MARSINAYLERIGRTRPEESLVFVQDKPYEIPVQHKEKPEGQKDLPAVSGVQIRKKSENSVQTERKKVVTKQDYERMSGKEKAEWLGNDGGVSGSVEDGIPNTGKGVSGATTGQAALRVAER